MKTYIYIGIGGILGTVSRYLIKGIHLNNYHGNFPLNTLIINITGSLILALILTVAFEIWEFDSCIRFGIATGLLGSYTTFSALSKETVYLLKDGLYFSAISYITLSIILGLTAVYLGIVIARKIISKLVRKENDAEAE